MEGREIDMPWPKALYEHGGGRELSTKQWDAYKEPVVHVVPCDDAAIERVAAKLAEIQGYHAGPLEIDRRSARALLRAAAGETP